jgi:uncharacterized protein YdbL (DUF1318 family)
MMNKLLNKIIIVLLAGSMLVSTAVASSLTGPKAEGWIGEQANGYLGLVRADAPADVKALVASVNKKRKARYQAIAKQQGIPVSEVEKVGGNETIEMTLRGNYIRDSSGRWRKK